MMQENIEINEITTALRGFQIVNQTRTAAVLYRGIRLKTNERGVTDVVALTGSGQGFLVGQYQDHDRAKQIIREIYSKYATNDDMYFMPAE
ncbi:MAG: hypothetical protein V8R14_05345 [Clostridia bacterium]